MKSNIARLSKGCIKEMVENSAKKPTRPYLLQVNQIRDKSVPGKIQKVMLLSDSVWYIKSVYSGKEEIREFDVVAIKEYHAAQMKEMQFIVPRSLSVAFTEIKAPIGNPVELNKSQPNVPDVDPVIPSTAVQVDKSITFDEGEADEEAQILAAALAPIPPAGKAEDTTKMEELKTVTAHAPTTSSKASLASQQSAAKMPKAETMTGVRPVKSLGAFTTDWTIKVRLTTKGKPKQFKKKSDGTTSALMPLEFVDEDGTQITATLFGRGVEKFNDLLQEGKCYFVSKGTVKFATKKYTSINNDHTITLDETSEIKLAVDDGAIKNKTYNFTPIQRLKDMPNGLLVDIIGVVHEAGPQAKIVSRDGQSVAKRTLTLFDDSREIISVTLWRELSEEHYTENQIIGLKNMRVTEFNKTKQLSSIGDTVVTVNPEDERTAVLKALQHCGLLIYIRISKGVVPVSVPKFKESLSLIAEIADVDEEKLGDSKGKYYCISGEIVSVAYDKGFCYTACASCKKKMQGDKCDKCGENKGTKVTYTFSIQVSDGTAIAWVHVFGDEGEKLLGKTAEEVKALKDQTEADHKQVFDNVKGRMYSFLVRLRREEYAENVKYRFQLIKIKDNEWVQENSSLLDKLRIYDRKMHQLFTYFTHI